MSKLKGQKKTPLKKKRISVNVVKKKFEPIRRRSNNLRRANTPLNRTRLSNIRLNSSQRSQPIVQFSGSIPLNEPNDDNNANLNGSIDLNDERPKRDRKQTERYGRRMSTSNHDEFFQQTSQENSFNHSAVSVDSHDSTRPVANLAAERETTRCDGSNTCTQHCEKNNILVLAKLNEILERISLIEKNMAKMDVRLRRLGQTVDQIDGGGIEKEDAIGLDFSQLGLPIKSLVSLNKLESDLQSEDFRQKMVIHLIK